MNNFKIIQSNKGHKAGWSLVLRKNGESLQKLQSEIWKA
jgi:hypothetical protein